MKKFSLSTCFPFHLDVSTNRKMLKLLLTKAGVEVDLAEDGLEAVTLILADPLKYDVIFMDNLMPKLVYFWMWNDRAKIILFLCIVFAN